MKHGGSFIWTGLQGDFKRLSTVSKRRIAEHSGHYIQHEEPEIVIEEIMRMLRERMK